MEGTATMTATEELREEERLAKLEREQEALDAGADLEPAGDPEDHEDAYARELAAAREAEGLNSKTALPEAADDAGAGQDPENLSISGDGQLSWTVGGKKPTSSKLRLTGGAFEVQGAIPKGTLITVEVQARVGGVAFDDTVDPKTTQATDCTRNHKARIVGAIRVEKGTIARLEELQDAARAFLESASNEDQARLAALLAPVE